MPSGNPSRPKILSNARDDRRLRKSHTDTPKSTGVIRGGVLQGTEGCWAQGVVRCSGLPGVEAFGREGLLGVGVSSRFGADLARHFATLRNISPGCCCYRGNWGNASPEGGLIYKYHPVVAQSSRPPSYLAVSPVISGVSLVPVPAVITGGGILTSASTVV
jgi:hypothetical protein